VKHGAVTGGAAARARRATAALLTPLLAPLLLGSLAAAVLCRAPAAVAQAPVPVDLELLLAIDTSSSINKEEYHLQVEGLASAFRHPAVIAAIDAAGNLGIAVAVTQWAETRDQILVLPWTRVDGAASVLAMAKRIAAIERRIPGGATGISSAIEFGIAQIESNGFEGTRRVIDLSGDGRANHGPIPSISRDRAVALGITVNGLAILNEIPLLDRYFRETVIGGSGAFVMAANDWVAFAQAMLEKLVREISQSPIAGTQHPRGPSLAAR